MRVLILIAALSCSCYLHTMPEGDADPDADESADTATLEADAEEPLDCDGVPDGEPVQCCSWSTYYWGTCHDGRVVGCGWCHEGFQDAG